MKAPEIIANIKTKTKSYYERFIRRIYKIWFISHNDDDDDGVVMQKRRTSAELTQLK